MSSGSIVRKLSRGLEGTLREIRRDFHQHPEIALKEKRTSGKVAEILRGLGVEVRTGLGKTGVVGLVRGARPGKTLALRADMDALPLQEANDVPYRSRHDGVMHACGHDGHMAILLGAAMILTKLRRQMRGNVKLLFQPAEETIAGALDIIRDGALERPRVHAIIGLHLKTELPLGVVGLRSGPLMAAANQFRITVSGRGGHGAEPHVTLDPLVPAHEIYQQCQSIRRNVDAFDPCVLSICAFHAGTAYNIIPQDAEILGTLRTFRPEVRDKAKRRLRNIVQGVAKSFGVQCRIVFPMTTPAVLNDPALVELAASAAGDVGLKVSDVPPTMGSEDFAFYLERVPGAFIRLGTGEKNETKVLHNNRFDFDEKVLPLGAALMAQCALRYLARR